MKIIYLTPHVCWVMPVSGAQLKHSVKPSFKSKVGDKNSTQNWFTEIYNKSSLVSKCC